MNTGDSGAPAVVDGRVVGIAEWSWRDGRGSSYDVCNNISSDDEWLTQN